MALRVRPTPSSGFSLVEVMIVLAVTSAIGLGFLAMMDGVTRNVSSAEARGAKLVVSDAIRMQLANKNTCVNSFLNVPTNWASAADVEVAINLNATETGPAPDDSSVVGAGRELRNFSNLKIKSLALKGLRKMSTSTTANFYAAAVEMTASSAQVGPTTTAEDSGRFALRPVRVASVVFEVPLAGGLPVGCFYANPDLDLNNLNTMFCTTMGGQMVAGKCVGGMSASTGRCSTKGVGSHMTNAQVASYFGDDLKCEEFTGELMKENSVPAAEKNNYIWYCPGKITGYPATSWDYVGPDPNKNLGNGWYKVGECQSNRRLVPPPPTTEADGSVVKSWPSSSNVKCYKPYSNPGNPSYSTGPNNPECRNELVCDENNTLAMRPTGPCIPPVPTGGSDSG